MFDLTTDPWIQQTVMSRFAQRRNYAWWLAGCGLGKTLAAIDVSRGHKRTLILTMKSLIDAVWVEEYENFTYGARYLPLLAGTAKTKARRVDEFYHGDKPGAVIVNYETAYRLPLRRWNFDFVFADESHKLKGYNGKMSQNIAQETGRAALKVAGTGTGWDDRPTDVYGQVRFLSPQHYPRKRILGAKPLGPWNEFYEEYVDYWERDNIKIPQGYKNQDKLAKILAPFTQTMKRGDWLDLTEAQEIVVPITLPKKHMNKYNELRDEMVTRFGDDLVVADNPLVKLLRLHQITGGFYQPYEPGAGTVPIVDGFTKLATLCDLCETFGDEPFVIYAQYRQSIALIREKLSALGISHGELTGEHSDTRDWLHGKCQALVIQLAAGNAGLNLTRAHFVVYYELSGSNTNHVQSKYRVHRPGQKQDVVYYYLVAKGTVDEAILKRLQDKTVTAEELRSML